MHNHGNAASEHKKHQKSEVKNLISDSNKISSKTVVHFSEKDRTNIINFFNTNSFAGTSLPPGIAKNLARGKPLPPGIAKKYLPTNLLSSLPNYPGYEYIIAGNDVLLVNTATQVITDVLKNLLK